MARIRLLHHGGQSWSPRSLMRYIREKKEQIQSASLSEFQAKSMQQMGVCEEGYGYVGLSWGAASLKGSCSRNDDTFVVGQPSGLAKTALFGVYDGHGINGGSQAAKLAAKQLHRFVFHMHVEGSTVHKQKPAEKVLEDAFVEFDRYLQRLSCLKKLKEKQEAVNRTLGTRGRLDLQQAGTCAILVLVGDSRVTVANLGDSQAICAAGKLTRLHHCSEPDEAQRISTNGGFISDERLNGRLMPTRAFGDFCFKSRHVPVDKQILSCLPEVKHIDRRECGEFLVLGSDGIFDVLAEPMVMTLCEENAHLSPGEIAKKIVDKALANGSLDNVTCVVVRMAPVAEEKSLTDSTKQQVLAMPRLQRVPSSTKVPSMPLPSHASARALSSTSTIPRG